MMYMVSRSNSRDVERVSTKPLTLGVLLFSANAVISLNVVINIAYAETGAGDDTFKVIMSVFGIEESKGDMVALVTVNNQESRVKFFDASSPEMIPMNVSRESGHILEYVATFPNVTVNSGDEYKGCVLTVKDMNLKCGTGYNSPANRPEFIDLNLDGTSTSESESQGLNETIRGMEDELQVTTAAASVESD
jgi:hypothetical protein